MNDHRVPLGMIFKYEGVILKKEKTLHVLKTITLATVLAMVSLVASFFLFYICLDNLLLRQFMGVFIQISLRIYLALVLFTIQWGLVRGRIPKFLILTLGILYTAILISVVMFKSTGIRQLNLNPLNVFRDLLNIPSLVVANFLFFVPVGIFVHYVFCKVKVRYLIILSFAVPLVFEVLQYIFRLGIADSIDVIINGCGIALGIWIMLLLEKSRRARTFLSV